MKKTGTDTHWASWIGFGGGMVAIALLTLWSIYTIQELLDPSQCAGIDCKPTDLFFPLSALLLGWLVAVTALMSFVVKAKPWK